MNPSLCCFVVELDNGAPPNAASPRISGFATIDQCAALTGNRAHEFIGADLQPCTSLHPFPSAHLPVLIDLFLLERLTESEQVVQVRDRELLGLTAAVRLRVVRDFRVPVAVRGLPCAVGEFGCHEAHSSTCSTNVKYREYFLGKLVRPEDFEDFPVG